MKNISKNKIGIFLVVLTGIGLSATSWASTTPVYPQMFLEFDTDDHMGVCGGFDRQRSRLVVDHCGAMLNRGDAQLSYHSDQTIRSNLTDQCLTRKLVINKALSFDPCEPGSDLQRFAFTNRTLGNGLRWATLVPVTGPAGAGTPIPDTCLVTNWPQLVGSPGPAGVFVTSCSDGEHSPNRVVHAKTFLSPIFPSDPEPPRYGGW